MLSFEWHHAHVHDLNEQKKKGKVPHALLLSAGAFEGQQALSHDMAKALLCEHEQAPCHQCQSCHWFEIEHHPDVCVLGANEAIGIDQIRALPSFVHLSAHHHYKVIVIDADKLNVQSSNALLKLLEEPTDSVVFILHTARAHGLLKTIVSRCVDVPMHAPSQSQYQAYLEHHQLQGCLYAHWFSQPHLVQALFEQDEACQQLLEQLVLLSLGQTSIEHVTKIMSQGSSEQGLYLIYGLITQLIKRAAGLDYQLGSMDKLAPLSMERLNGLSQSWHQLSLKLNQGPFKAQYLISDFLVQWQQTWSRT